jgi:hypothetical protein
MLALAAMDSITGSAPLVLSCHPRTPSQAIRAIGAVVGAAPDGVLSLAFTLEGDLSGLRIPEPRQPRQADGLWRHTCFEAFVMTGDGPGYREFNFAPSREWAVYAFRGYRDGGELKIELAPGIVVRRTANRLELDAKICHDFLPPGRPLRLGLSAVVEDAGGALSYWALRHPPGKPDFHHQDAFAFQPGLP